MCVLLWPVALAGDGGGEKHSTGDDVSGPEALARSVSTGVILERDEVFELTSGGSVAETRGCLLLVVALTGGVDGPSLPVSRPIESLLGSSVTSTSMERYD